MEKKINHNEENTEESQKENRNSWDKKLMANMPKLDDLYELRELKDLRQPITIITIACVVIAVCSIFMTISLFNITKLVSKIYTYQSYIIRNNGFFI